MIPRDASDRLNIARDSRAVSLRSLGEDADDASAADKLSDSAGGMEGADAQGLTKAKRQRLTELTELVIAGRGTDADNIELERLTEDLETTEASSSQTSAIFREVDMDGGGTISFDEFSRWWVHRQMITGEVSSELNEGMLKKMKNIWNEADEDGSGELDPEEFDVILTRMAQSSHWTEAYDEGRKMHYFYNTETGKTRWLAQISSSFPPLSSTFTLFY